MLTKLSLEALLDGEFVGRHRAERVLNSEVPCVRYFDRRIVKTYDYINRVVKTLPLTVYEGTWTTISPLVAMHHHDLAVRRIFLKLLRSPTVVSEPGLCVDVICTSRTQVSCGRN